MVVRDFYVGCVFCKFVIELNKLDVNGKVKKILKFIVIWGFLEIVINILMDMIYI